MIKFMTILIGCSLTFAAGVRAEQENPENKPDQKSKPVPKQQVAPKQHAMPNTHAPGPNVQHKDTVIPGKVKVHDNNMPKQQLHTLPAVQSNKMPADQSNKLPAVQSNKLPAVQSNKSPAVNKHIVQKFHAEHPNFRAKPSTTITSAQFNPSYRIQAAQNWNGTQYNAFRSYQPQWHDRGWWGSHHNNLSLIGGGWYYWDSGYWYPAWGYDDSAAYYPYDGPIYVGRHVRPFDQVVADVQSVLQEQGYYHGEVDGLVGPLTQEALATYQSAQGLPPTAAVDEPTLESLGLG
jgi:Putative peptidoglycan binding domain